MLGGESQHKVRRNPYQSNGNAATGPKAAPGDAASALGEWSATRRMTETATGTRERHSWREPLRTTEPPGNRLLGQVLQQTRSVSTGGRKQHCLASLIALS
jgi:hypothetical protein